MTSSVYMLKDEKRTVFFGCLVAAAVNKKPDFLNCEPTFKLCFVFTPLQTSTLEHLKFWKPHFPSIFSDNISFPIISWLKSHLLGPSSKFWGRIFRVHHNHLDYMRNSTPKITKINPWWWRVFTLLGLFQVIMANPDIGGKPRRPSSRALLRSKNWMKWFLYS